MGKFRIIANAKMMARQKNIQYVRTTKSFKLVYCRIPQWI